LQKAEQIGKKKEKAQRLKLRLREQVKELEKMLKERAEDVLNESKIVREWH
jgi:hypothetical protein